MSMWCYRLGPELLGVAGVASGSGSSSGGRSEDSEVAKVGSVKGKCGIYCVYMPVTKPRGRP